MKNQLIAADNRLKCKKIEVQICLKSKMKYTWNCQKIVKTSTLMNKIALQVESREFANLSAYAETKINKQIIKSKNAKKL